MNRKGMGAKAPTKSFKKCPACGCKELLPVGVDVLCGACDWGSMQSHVDSGGMDNIFSAYIDHFMGDHEVVKLPAGRKIVQKQLEAIYADPVETITSESEMPNSLVPDLPIGAGQVPIPLRPEHAAQHIDLEEDHQLREATA